MYNSKYSCFILHECVTPLYSILIVKFASFIVFIVLPPLSASTAIIDWVLLAYVILFFIRGFFAGLFTSFIIDIFSIGFSNFLSLSLSKTSFLNTNPSYIIPLLITLKLSVPNPETWFASGLISQSYIAGFYVKLIDFDISWYVTVNVNVLSTFLSYTFLHLILLATT